MGGEMEGQRSEVTSTRGIEESSPQGVEKLSQDEEFVRDVLRAAEGNDEGRGSTYVTLRIPVGEGILGRNIAARVLPDVARQAELSAAWLRGNEVLLTGSPDAVQYAQDLLESATNSIEAEPARC